MSSYVPSEPRVGAMFAVVLVVVLFAGYMMGRGYVSAGIARALAWTTVFFGTLGVERLVADEPAGVRMVALITFALLVMKIIVVIEERARGMGCLSLGAW